MTPEELKRRKLLRKKCDEVNAAVKDVFVKYVVFDDRVVKFKECSVDDNGNLTKGTKDTTFVFDCSIFLGNDYQG